MKRIVFASLLGVVLATALNTLVGAAQLTFMNGLGYTFPPSHAAALLQNDGFGALSWTGSAGTPAVPANAIMWTMNGVCPAGFVEYTTAQGRYIVGLVSAGTNEATVGTALTNVEDRSVGVHSHTASVSINISFSGHTHTLSDPSHYHGSATDYGSPIHCNSDTGCVDGPFTVMNSSYCGNTGSSGLGSVSISNASSGTSIAHGDVVVNNTGTTAGTNAPYMQLMACRKS